MSSNTFDILDRREGDISARAFSLAEGWPATYSYVVVGVLTLACLLPFSGRAFHVDDTLFVMVARQVTHHPFNPYGFSLVWNDSVERMADVTQNPPLAGYYGALVGEFAGWSERAFHLAFLLPALALAFGTYRLAGHFTRFPLLATLATILTPGVLGSAASVMCDTMMVALWLWAMILWIEGLEPRKAWYLAGAGVLMAAAFLTKYLGVALIPLLAAYSVVRLRRVENWIWYLLIPVGAVVGYDLWTHALYGHNMLAGAVRYANTERGPEAWVSVWIGLSFTGGCALSVLTLAPVTWSRKALGIAAAVGALASAALIFGWLDYHGRDHGVLAFNSVRAHWMLVGSQLAIFIAGGLLTFALAISDSWKRRDVDSLLLLAWVTGIFIFASFLNWTVNARSVLPLIPAAGILIARRLETRRDAWSQTLNLQVACALIVSGALSIWVLVGDTQLANLAREAAYSVQQQAGSAGGTIWYRDHWGFQYYMDQLGARSIDVHNFQIRPGDHVVVSERFAELFRYPDNLSMQNERVLEFANHSG